MKTQIKCSNCGNEFENINVDWGRKQFWLILPIILIGFYPLAKMTLFKSVISKDLSISEVETKVVGNSLEIIGLITNSSRNEWSGVSVEAEFYDASGKFLDEESQYLRTDIAGNSKEYFKINLSSPPEDAINGIIQPKLKLSGGHTSAF